MGSEAERLRQRAAGHRADARESFERCDTDGFLSQYASGINARLCEQQAAIAENGGRAVFARWVVMKDGQDAGAVKVRTRFGDKWRIDADDVWMAYGSARAAKRKGYEVVEVVEMAEARAVIDGSGHGLSGQAWVAVYRVGAKRSDGWRCVGIKQDDRQDEYKGAID